MLWSRVWLELPLRSFKGLESTHTAPTGNGVVGDLYDSGHSRWRMTAEKQRSELKHLEYGPHNMVSSLVYESSIPGRRHQAAPTISHPAIVRETAALRAWATLPVLSQSLLPAVTLNHNLAAWTKRLKKPKRLVNVKLSFSSNFYLKTPNVPKWQTKQMKERLTYNQDCHTVLVAVSEHKFSKKKSVQFNEQ